jgi:hypothetical protein
MPKIYIKAIGTIKSARIRIMHIFAPIGIKSAPISTRSYFYKKKTKSNYFVYLIAFGKERTTHLQNDY